MKNELRKNILLICISLLIFACSKEDGEFRTISTTEYTSIRIANEEKALIVNVFASWCKPCAAETPDLVSAYNSFDKSKMMIIGLSVDNSEKDLKAFIEKHNIKYPVYRIDSKLEKELKVSSIPTTIIYGKRGEHFATLKGTVTADLLQKSYNALGQ